MVPSSFMSRALCFAIIFLSKVKGKLVGGLLPKAEPPEAAADHREAKRTLAIVLSTPPTCDIPTYNSSMNCLRQAAVVSGLLVLISATGTTHSFSANSGPISASVQWTTKVYTIPGDPGPPVFVTAIGSAHVTFSGKNIEQTTSSLDFFNAAFEKNIVEWVNGRSDGCGAATRTAFVHSAQPTPPYIVFFTVLAQKGCEPMALVFYPSRSGHNWRYIPAPSYAPALIAIKRYAPIVLSSTFRIESVRELKLPAAYRIWKVWLARGTLNGKPATIVLDFRDSAARYPVIVRPGDRYSLGTQSGRHVAALN